MLPAGTASWPRLIDGPASRVPDENHGPRQPFPDGGEDLTTSSSTGCAGRGRNCPQNSTPWKVLLLRNWE